MQLFVNNEVKVKTEGFISLINSFLFRQVDNSPLILFRILFGLLIFLECSGSILTGWVKEAFIDPTFTFTFIDFYWLPKLSGLGMYFYFALMALAGLMIMFGCFYQIAIITFFLLWTVAYLTQKSIYNNHYYLLVLLSFIMSFLPANKFLSYDARAKRTSESFVCDQWCIWVLIIQVSIVYIYAGIAKLYPDWLEGRPVEIWFSHRLNYPFIGKLLQLALVKKMVVYGGIFFDLLIVPLLLYRRTRVFGFLLGVFFHLFNSLVFLIGIFPFMMISLNMLFFPGKTIRNFIFRNQFNIQSGEGAYGNNNYLIFAGIVVYFSIQIILPLRHHFYEGNVYWTEEGHRMAWHMMVRNKTGNLYFKIYHPVSKRTWMVFPEKNMSIRQYKSLATSPDMIWQYADFLNKYYKLKGLNEIEIYAIGEVSLNGRRFQPLIDEKINLAKVKWNYFRHSEWILPLLD
jgi:vitamin K-dependent gamma-carboxylase